MAILSNASGGSGSYPVMEIGSAVIDYSAAYTVCFWYYHNANSSLDSYAWYVSDGNNGDYDRMYVDSAGIFGGSALKGYVGVEGGGSTLSTGTWYHLAYVRTSITVAGTYLNGVIDVDLSSDMTGRVASNRMRMLAANTFHVPIDGRVSAPIFYSRALSSEELKAQMRSHRPISLISLYGWWSFVPGIAAARLVDRSGNGHNWTESNALGFAEDPPVRWGGDATQYGFGAIAGGSVLPQIVYHRKMQGVA